MARDFRRDTESEPNMRASSPVSELVDALLEWSKPDTGSHDAGVQLVCELAASTLTSFSTRNAELEREVKRLREVMQEIEDSTDLTTVNGHLYDRVIAALSTSPQGGEHE